MVEKMNGLSREFIIHPGETLKELLDDKGMSQRELAARTGVTESHISSVVNGQKAISVSFAKKLEYALNIDSVFWINLQANYDKELADYEEINGISSEELEILKPLSGIVEHLKENNFLETEEYGAILVVQLRKLLNVSSLIQIPKVSQLGAYRLAKANDVDPYVLFTWLRMCDLIVGNQGINKKLDVDRLKETIPLIKLLMYEEFANIKPRLTDHFAECGIKFSIVKNFKGAPVQGVIKENEDGTLSLIMTTRRKFADIFWFTLFHEIGHIINDDIDEKLIDYDFAEGEAEEKADKFASNTLIDEDRYYEFVKAREFTKNSIEEFSAENGIPSYVLIGRLQKDEHIPYHRYSNEKVKYSLA